MRAVRARSRDVADGNVARLVRRRVKRRARREGRARMTPVGLALTHTSYTRIIWGCRTLRLRFPCRRFRCSCRCCHCSCRRHYCSRRRRCHCYPSSTRRCPALPVVPEHAGYSDSSSAGSLTVLCPTCRSKAHSMRSPRFRNLRALCRSTLRTRLLRRRAWSSALPARMRRCPLSTGRTLARRRSTMSHMQSHSISKVS
jgi:hypothetical protein